MVVLAASLSLSLLGLDGRAHDVVREAAGEPIAVVFIASACPVSNGYAPEFARIAKAYAGRAWVAFVYTEPGLSLDRARKHAAEYSLTGAHLYLDTKGKAAKMAGAFVTPEAAVFAPGGRRTYLGRVDNLFYDFGKQRPAATTHDLRAALDATIAHRQTKVASGPPFGCVIETDKP